MSNRICAIDIDEKGLARVTPTIEQERNVAIFDLLEDNSFALPLRDGRARCPAPTVWVWRSAKAVWSLTLPPKPRKR
jgi:hypothetical protein